MEELNAVTIYWIISIGLLVGFFMSLLMGERGLSLAGNLLGGVAGALLIGVSVYYFELFAPLVYAVIGSIAFLFLVNVFRLEPDHKQEADILHR